MGIIRAKLKPPKVSLRAINAIQFGILDPKFIENYSVCEVSECNPIEIDGIHPKLGGLSDIRMGPSVYSGQTTIRCSTDNSDAENCPGYFGHIKLGRPVYHISFVKT